MGLIKLEVVEDTSKLCVGELDTALLVGGVKDELLLRGSVELGRRGIVVVSPSIINTPLGPNEIVCSSSVCTSDPGVIVVLSAINSEISPVTMRSEAKVSVLRLVADGIVGMMLVSEVLERVEGVDEFVHREDPTAQRVRNVNDMDKIMIIIFE